MHQWQRTPKTRTRISFSISDTTDDLTPQMTSNEGPASAAENGLLALNLSGGVMLMFAAGVSE